MLDVFGLSLGIAGMRSPHCYNALSKPGCMRRRSRGPPVFCNREVEALLPVWSVRQG